MDVVKLNQLARRLRDIALAASQSGRELPVSVSELAVLEAVARKPDMTITALSDATGYAQSRVSKLVTALAADGVVQTIGDPSDRRRTVVRLTPDAHREAFEEYGTRDVTAAIAAAATHLTPGEVDRAVRLTEELATLLAPPL
ncbi:MarR family winged helix-turn-helix transcriptional regulator [Rhodococcus qingshengii]|uniref:MarR family winged helix-turn-helix transcriptional regulator n=1 Tax=Rhodococcus qingshengii TaxID=334542 RepID=UPI001C8C43D1|nr:MarR family winged helix-turn-helix transcriptional regulator [Rhodococcus qingshengii]MBX9152085.1 winged helix-turn-helix transcriptional regulator [Rhodococcus qingshengii]